MVEQALQAGGGTQPQVFVSYARHDAQQVLTITRLLEQEGVSVWRDEERILGGQYYGEQIVHAIAHSRVVVLMCSPQAFQSDNVHTEVLLTWDHYHRRYIPVWLALRPTSPSDSATAWRAASGSMRIPSRRSDGCRNCSRRSSPWAWTPGVRRSNPADRLPGRPARPGEGGRPGLRFRPGDKPIRGADWELERLLGKGGFGEVWKARNPHLSSVPPVALKFCLELDERGKDLLRHEADMVLRAQQQIRSTGIVPLLHAYLSNDPPCLEYPYIEGGTLVRLLDESRESASPLTPVHVQRIVEQIAKIVSPGHRATPKLVHRDLKPSNILVERRGDRKVVLRGDGLRHRRAGLPAGAGAIALLVLARGEHGVGAHGVVFAALCLAAAGARGQAGPAGRRVRPRGDLVSAPRGRPDRPRPDGPEVDRRPAEARDERRGRRPAVVLLRERPRAPARRRRGALRAAPGDRSLDADEVGRIGAGILAGRTRSSAGSQVTECPDTANRQGGDSPSCDRRKAPPPRPPPKSSTRRPPRPPNNSSRPGISDAGFWPALRVWSDCWA